MHIHTTLFWTQVTRLRFRIWPGMCGEAAVSPLGSALRQRSSREGLLLEELPDHRGGVLLFAVHRVIHSAHFISCNAAGKLMQGGKRGRTRLKQFWSSDQDGIVRREVVAIVGQHNQTESRDQAVGV